jgi:hypothetical protein
VRARFLALVLATVVVAGCTSSHGTGTDSSVARPSESPSAPTSSTSATSRPAPTSSAPNFPPPEFARASIQTAIGDPVTADLCAVVGTDVFAGLGTLTATLDGKQFPPGCSATLTTSAGVQFAVSVFAARHHTPSTGDHTTRARSGQTIYVYPFEQDTGGCQRQVAAQEVWLVVDSFAQGSEKPSEDLACGATDAMADALATAAAAASVPRLSLAAPSVSELAACPVLAKAGVTKLSAFASAHLLQRGFGENCEVKTDRVLLFVNFAIADQAKPATATATTVLGHRLYSVESRPDFCSFVSTQGQTGDGRYEQVAAAATATDPDKPPGQLCAETGEVLARYLTTAGLS